MIPLRSSRTREARGAREGRKPRAQVQPQERSAGRSVSLAYGVIGCLSWKPPSSVRALSEGTRTISACIGAYADSRIHSNALRCHAGPLRSLSVHCLCVAMLGLALAVPSQAMPLLCFSVPLPSDAPPRGALPCHCTAWEGFAVACMASHRPAAAHRRCAVPLHCQPYPGLASLMPRHFRAELCPCLACQGVAMPIHRGAPRSKATHRFAFASHCVSFLRYSDAMPSGAGPMRVQSKLGLCVAMRAEAIPRLGVANPMRRISSLARWPPT